MAHIYAFLSGIIMTLTWKIEKPCKYSDWKKNLRKTLHLLVCTVASRGGGAEPLTVASGGDRFFVQFTGFTFMLRSNSHQRKLKIQCLHTEAVSLKESQWRSTSLQDHEMLHPIPH